MCMRMASKKKAPVKTPARAPSKAKTAFAKAQAGKTQAKAPSNAKTAPAKAQAEKTQAKAPSKAPSYKPQYLKELDGAKSFILPQKEEEVLKFWRENKIYEMLKEREKSWPEFRFIDGPPTLLDPFTWVPLGIRF